MSLATANTSENRSEDILNDAREASSLLPLKSKEKSKKAKALKASSLWSTYSMLKITLQMNENVDISQNKKLLAFLKCHNDTYEANESKVLTMENVIMFFKEAPDNEFLLMKLILIFGLNGPCRRAELCSWTVEDMENTEKILIITSYDTKTQKKLVFTVVSECNGNEIYPKYSQLRPKQVKQNRFFIYYNHSKCTTQPVGLNSFTKIPQKVAEYFKLPDASSYTGHCLRRTSATFLVDSGADIETLKIHGGWQSTSVAKGYIEESIVSKLKISKSIFHQQELAAPLDPSGM